MYSKHNALCEYIVTNIFADIHTNITIVSTILFTDIVAVNKAKSLSFIINCNHHHTAMFLTDEEEVWSGLLESKRNVNYI